MEVITSNGDLFGPKTTGATGSTSHANQGAASDVFGTSAPQGTGAPGSNGSGPKSADSQSVTHGVDYNGAYSYGTTSTTGGTSPDYQGGFGAQYVTDTGADAGQGALNPHFEKGGN